MTHIRTHRTNLQPFRDEGPHRAGAETGLTHSVLATQRFFGTPSRMRVWISVLCLLLSSSCGSQDNLFWDTILWDSRTSFVSILALALAIATVAYLVSTWEEPKEEKLGYGQIALWTWVVSIIIHIASTIIDLAGMPWFGPTSVSYKIVAATLVIIGVIIVGVVPYMLASAIVACSYFVLVLPIELAAERSRKAKELAAERSRLAAERSRLAAERSRKAKELEIEEHKKLLNQMIHAVHLVPSHIERMSSSLESADAYLESAASNFSNRAFAPFWDCIVHAISDMGRYQKIVRKLSKLSSLYVRLRSSYSIDVVGKKAPKLTLPVKSIEALKGRAISTSQRLERIVHTAQSDFEFSLIYEQRRTNDILVAGFGSLENALTNMSRAITKSLQILDQSIGDLSMGVEDVGMSVEDVRMSVERTRLESRGNQETLLSQSRVAMERAEEIGRGQNEAASESRERDEEMLKILKSNRKGG